MTPRTETELVDQVIELATLNGWLVTHFRPARTTAGYRTALQGHKGYVDLTIAKRGVVHFWEAKSDTGRLSKQQHAWLEALGPNARVIRPGDFETFVVPMLTGRAVGTPAGRSLRYPRSLPSPRPRPIGAR